MQRVFLTIWMLMTGIVALTFFTPFEFTSPILACVLLVFSIIGLPLFFWMYTSDKTAKSKWRKWTFFLGTCTVLGISIARFFSWGSGYKTQTVVYKKIASSTVTIEYQMEDIGALGYNRRVVRITQVTPLLRFIAVTDTNEIDLSKWRKVEEFVNELGLKGG